MITPMMKSLWGLKPSAALWIIVCLVGSRALLAADSDKPLAQFVVDQWGIERGLPELAVQALLRTKDGYLWIGTQEGLARFDGAQMTVFDRSNTASMKSDYITTLSDDSQGNLWIGTRDGLVERDINGVFQAFGHEEGFDSKIVTSSARDGDNVWVGGDHGLVTIVSGKIVRTYSASDGLVDNRVSDLAMLYDGSLIVLTNGHVQRIGNGVIDSVGADSVNDAVKIFAISKQEIFIQTSKSLLSYEDGKWSPSLLLGTNRTERVRDIVKGANGDIWIATSSSGLFRRHINSDGSVVLEQTLADTRIETIYEDTRGDVWVGTLGRGLVRLHDGAFTTVDKRSGLLSDSALSVVDDANGAMWIGTLKGLTRFSDGHPRNFTIADGLPSNYISALAPDVTGGVWIGLRQNELIHLKNQMVDLHTVLKPKLPSTTITSLFVDRKERLWAGTNGGGLATITNGQTTYHSISDNPDKNYIETITEDSLGNVWVGSLRGIWLIREDKIQEHPIQDSRIDGVTVNAIFEDARNVIWIGTTNGLFRVDSQSVFLFNRQNGLADETINGIVDDGRDNLWLSSNHGVFEISLAQAGEFANGSATRLDVAQFGTDDGMATSETSSGTSPVAWRARDGRLWFVTSDGVSSVDPKTVSAPPAPSQPIVESVIADGTLLHIDRSGVEIPAGTSRVEIRYTTPNLEFGKTINFRYQLNDVDSNWTVVGPERVARYVNIAPGAHTFSLESRRFNGKWAASATPLEIKVLPTFLQTRWFKLIAATAFILICFGFYRLRLAILRMDSAISDERQRIAGEIHDNLTQGFTAILVQIDAGLRRISQNHNLGVSHLKLAADVARESLHEARRSVWNLQSTSPSTDSLASTIRSACEQIVFESNIKVVIAVVGKPWISRPSVEHNLISIAREAVANAARHGHASEIRLTIKYSRTALDLQILDNGIGFEVGKMEAKKNRGFGLSSMRRRAKGLKGAFFVTSASGVGSRVRVSVPRNPLTRIFSKTSEITMRVQL